jgi:hypothetical protein
VGLSAWLGAVAPVAASVASADPVSADGNSVDDALNAANNPLTPKITVNLQDYFSPVLNREPGRTSNEFLTRGLIPSDTFGLPQLVRVTLPVYTNPTDPTGSVTGLGDASIYDLFVLPLRDITLSVGPVLVAPTATSRATGTGKWQAGAAAFMVTQHPWGVLVGLLTYQHSFAGDPSRPTAQQVTAQPIVTYNLPESFYLRSTGIWTFDLSAQPGGHTTVIPVGFGIGKVWTSGPVTMNLFVEPQYSVIHSGVGVPTWQIFGGFTVQIALARK